MAERYQARSVLPRSFRCLPDTRRVVQGTILATRYPERCWGFALPRRFSQVLRERHSRVQCKFGEMSMKSMNWWWKSHPPWSGCELWRGTRQTVIWGPPTSPPKASNLTEESYGASKYFEW